MRNQYYNKRLTRPVKILLILLTQLPTLAAIGQNEYYSTDTISIIGLLNLVDGGDKMNARYCQVNNKGEITKYTPYEVKEYCLNSGKVYVSKEIQSGDSLRRVFLERLYDGDLTLFYYKNEDGKAFFLETDSSFIELPGKGVKNPSYQERLLPFTLDCPSLAKSTKLVNYRKFCIHQFVRKLNTCDRKPFRFMRFGLSFGYTKAYLGDEFGVLTSLPYAMQPNPDGSATVGLFIDFPILSGNFSFHTSLHYSRYAISYNQHHDKRDFDLVANISDFKMPLMIRYTFPRWPVRPFVNAGIMAVYHSHAEFDFYQSIISPGQIEIVVPYSISFTGFQTGYTVGAGIEFSITYRNSMFLELRYDDLFKDDQVESIDMSTLYLVAGINF
nr:PorT family protein [Bacteroidota bacterium]